MHGNGDKDGWNKPILLEGAAKAQPVAVTWGINRLDVFVEFSDRKLWHTWRDGDDTHKFEPWELLGGEIVYLSGPVSWGPNRLDVSVRGVDDGLHPKSWDGSRWWPSEEGWGLISQHGEISGYPVEISWGTGRLDLFVHHFKTGKILHKAHVSPNWLPNQTDWASDLGMSSTPGTLHVVAPGSDLLDIVFLDKDQAVQHKAWNGTNCVPKQSDEWDNLGGKLAIACLPELAPWIF
jgi:hypothetical protein